MTRRVLMVAPFPPPYGGIASFAANLLEGLRDRNVAVIPYNTNRYERLRLRPPGDDRSYRRALDPRNALFLLALILDWAPYSWTLLRFRPDVVHVHTASSWSWWRSMLYILFARLFGRKTVFHVHNAIDSFYARESGRLARRLICLSLRIPHHVIVLSEGLRAFVRGIADVEISAVYNGLQVEAFRNDKRYDPPFMLLFAGAVGTQKGVADLIEAVGRSGLDDRRLRLTVMGDGDIAGMRRNCVKLGLGDQVTFTGRVSDAAKLDLFRSHHVYAMPSYAEGQPISILEGMAAGMAILSTTVGSIPEVVRHGENGYLVTPGDIDGLAQGIRRLLQPEQLARMGAANRRLAKERFEFSRVVGDVLDAYDAAAVGRAGRR